MEALWHWLTALDEVYRRHAGRHGPNRLLPAEVLPPYGRVPEPAEPSPQSAGPDGPTDGVEFILGRDTSSLEELNDRLGKTFDGDVDDEAQAIVANIAMALKLKEQRR
jgi:hypothetical protein